MQDTRQRGEVSLKRFIVWKCGNTGGGARILLTETESRGGDGQLQSQARLGGQMRVSGLSRLELPQGLTGRQTGRQAGRQQGGN